jgi:hypothetical protein
VRLDVTNEASALLVRAGQPGLAPYRSTEHAISTWPTTAPSIGVRHDAGGFSSALSAGPFAMVVRANKTVDEPSTRQGRSAGRLSGRDHRRSLTDAAGGQNSGPMERRAARNCAGMRRALPTGSGKGRTTPAAAEADERRDRRRPPAAAPDLPASSELTAARRRLAPRRSADPDDEERRIALGGDRWGPKPATTTSNRARSPPGARPARARTPDSVPPPQ